MTRRFTSLRYLTRTQISALCIILATIVFSERAYGQVANRTAENPESGNALLRERALDLLDSLADQIGTLQSAENRARFGSNIAAALWKHDENRARTLLVSVQSDINAGLRNVDDAEADGPRTRVVFLQLRVDTIERIAKYDPDLALDFLNATEPVSDSTLPYELAETVRALEMRLAKQVAASSPEMTLKLARKMMARGFTFDLQTLLFQLNRKHKEQTVVLYQEIVAKLRDANLMQDYGAFHFGLRLAKSFKPPAADEKTFRELIGVFVDQATRNGCANTRLEQHERAWFCSQVGSLLPEIEKIDAARAATLKRWASENESLSRWSPEADAELNELGDSATVDEILALTTKYPQMKGEIYFRAIKKLMASGDLERARKLAADFDDPGMRKAILAEVDRIQKWNAITEEEVAEMQRALPTVRRIEDRVKILTAFAGRIGQHDRKTALKLLDQASEIIDGASPGKQQTETRIGLAVMYCAEKSDRGLAIMESLMPLFNELVAAAVKLHGYENRHLRGGEWNMSNEGAVGSFLTGLAQNAGHFAWCDFDRAVNLAAQFERPEIRLMAQLKLAQGILSGPPKRSPTYGQHFRY